MILNKAHIILVFFVVWSIISVFITYGISIYEDHISYLFFYISDTGMFPDVSCLFSEFLNINAFTLSFLVIIRFYHIKQALKKTEYEQKARIVLRINLASLILGLISAFGVTIVGNFQEDKLYPSHYIGAFIAFSSMIIYIWIHSFFSHILSLVLYSNSKIFFLRIFLSTISTLGMFLMILLKISADYHFTGENYFNWEYKDGGYTEHAISVSFEWITSIATVLVMGTFYPDFQKIKFEDLKTYEISRRKPSNSFDSYEIF